MSPLRILVTGSRDWRDLYTVEVALRSAFLKRAGTRRPQDVIVVHGGAPGADACAAVLAPRMGFQVEEHPADWDRHGRRAGTIRNNAMVAAGADVALAFAKSWASGTGHCARAARAAGIPTIDYGVDTRAEARPATETTRQLDAMVAGAGQLGLYEQTAEPRRTR